MSRSDPIDASAMTLLDTLWRLGLRTGPALDYGRKAIMDGEVCVFAGRAGQVWDWLRETGRIK